MWIEQVFIENFGIFTNLSIYGLQPGLSVIIGPNEAGKSTLAEFIRSVLFGYKTRNGKANTYEPPDGASRKGRLKFKSSDGLSLRMERIERPGMKEGAVDIWDENGNRIDPAEIPEFRHTMGRAKYEALSALDLDRMRYLDREALRGRIISAALGSLAVSPLDVATSIEDRAKALGKKSLKNPQCLWAMQAKLNDLNARLEKLKGRSTKYICLTEELVQVEKRREEISDETTVVEAFLEDMKYLSALEEDWKKLCDLDRETAAYSDAQSFPADGLVRLERILQKRIQLEEELINEKKALERTNMLLDTCRPDHALIASLEKIHILSREGEALRNRPREIEKKRIAIEQEYRDFENETTSIGKQWTRLRVAELDPSLKVDYEIRKFQTQWKTRQEKIRMLEERIHESSDMMSALSERISLEKSKWREISPLCSGFLSPRSLAALAEWKDCRNRIADLKEKSVEKLGRIRATADERAYLEDRLTALRQDRTRKIPPILFGTLIVLLVTTGVFLLQTLSNNAGTAWYCSLILGLTALIFVPGVIIRKFKWERDHRTVVNREINAVLKKSKHLLQQIAILENHRREATREIQELLTRTRKIAQEILGTPQAEIDDVTEAEKRSASAEEPFRRRRLIEERIHELQIDLEAEQKRHTHWNKLLEAAEGDFVRLQREWDRALIDLGIDSGWEPDAALALLERLRELRQCLSRLEEEENLLAVMETEWLDFVRKVELLARDMGKNFDEVFPPDLVNRWLRMGTEATATLAENKALEQRIEDHRIKLSVLDSQAAKAQREIAALMDAAGSENEEDFRNRALRNTMYETAVRDRRILVERLIAALRCADEAALRTEMNSLDWRKNKRLFAEHQERLRCLRLEAEDFATRQGRLKQEIEALEHEEDTAEMHVELEAWSARFNQALREWFVLKLAGGLLEKTLSFYESEKQPKVLENASLLFSRISGEKGARVLFPLGTDHVVVERPDGTLVHENHLSRGTLEQVYLALKLAHLDVYHKDDCRMPLIMDDVLVNFDPMRAKRAAETLTLFSEETGRQILFFTCHSHIVELFPDNVPKIDLHVPATECRRMTIPENLSLFNH